MLLEDIFLEALPSIDPKRLVLESLREKSFSNEKVHVIGFGKAAAGMAAGIIEFFGENIIEGIISIPVGTRQSMEQNNRTDLWPVHERVKVLEVAKDNLPDQAAVDSSNLILDFVKTLQSDDKLIVCCSGGGSACLACPADWISLEDKLKIIKKLQSKGATIQELNAIRSLLSKTKGGRLLAATKATVTTLILSDIIGDPVELIASGPTVQADEKDETFYADLLTKYDLQSNFTSRTIIPQTFPTNTSEIIGNNQRIIKKIEAICCTRKIPYHSLGNEISGEARDLAKFYVRIAQTLQNKSSFLPSLSDLDVNTPSLSETFGIIRDMFDKHGEVLLVAGGEPTVTLLGDGKGGRNQELALAFEIESSGTNTNASFLSAGTDGQDGPCDVSGAWTGAQDSDVIDNARSFLENSDSYNYFKKHAPHRHIKTGLTFTNVMDIHLLHIKAHR